MSDILKEAIDMAEETIAHHDEETRALKAEIERLTAVKDAARRCHLEAEQANTRLSAEIERLTALINNMDCDSEWCGKSPTKYDNGKCDICNAQAAVDKGES